MHNAAVISIRRLALVSAALFATIMSAHCGSPPPPEAPLAPASTPATVATATPAAAPATAGGAPQSACLQMLDADSVAIRSTGSGPTGWSGYDVTVDLTSHQISGTRSQDKEKKVYTRTLDSEELDTLVNAFKPLCLKAETAGDAAFGGGGGHFEIKQRDGKVRLLGYQNSAPSGSVYYPVPNPIGFGLAEAYPAPDKKRAPPSTEVATRIFMEELMFGTPFGARDIAWSKPRLDPKGDRFDFIDLSSTSSSGPRFQLTPKRPDVLRVRELAKEVDIEKPIAYLVNGEHNVWELGDAATKKPIRKWRLGEIEVRLNMPKSVRVSSYTGQIESIDGATIDFIIVQLPKDKP